MRTWVAYDANGENGTLPDRVQVVPIDPVFRTPPPEPRQFVFQGLDDGHPRGGRPVAKIQRARLPRDEGETGETLGNRLLPPRRGPKSAGLQDVANVDVLFLEHEASHIKSNSTFVRSIFYLPGFC